MTTTLLTVGQVRAAQCFVGRQHAGAAAGEGLNRSRPSREQVIEQGHRVGDVYRLVPVGVERSDTTHHGASLEQPVQGAGGVGDVHPPVVVAVAPAETDGGRFYVQRLADLEALVPGFWSSAQLPSASPES